MDNTAFKTSKIMRYNEMHLYSTVSQFLFYRNFSKKQFSLLILERLTVYTEFLKRKILLI